MAQHGVRPRGKHGGHPPALSRQDPMADRIHPSMDGQKPAKVNAVVNRVCRNANVEQLAPGDDAVLPIRKLGDDPLNPRPLGFTAYIRVESEWVGGWRRACGHSGTDLRTDCARDALRGALEVRLEVRIELRSRCASRVRSSCANVRAASNRNDGDCESVVAYHFDRGTIPAKVHTSSSEPSRS